MVIRVQSHLETNEPEVWQWKEQCVLLLAFKCLVYFHILHGGSFFFFMWFSVCFPSQIQGLSVSTGLKNSAQKHPHMSPNCSERLMGLLAGLIKQLLKLQGQNPLHTVSWHQPRCFLKSKMQYCHLVLLLKKSQIRKKQEQVSNFFLSCT